MNINEKQQALIEKYLDKSLSSIQKSSFEEELKNEQFRKQLLFQAQLMDAHRANEKENILNELETFAQANRDTNKNRKYLGVLIGIVLISLLLFSIFFKSRGNNRGEMLYADYYVELPSDVNTRGTISNQSDIYSKSMQSYVKKDYANALQGFESIETQTALTKLYTAVCELKIGDHLKAEHLFTELMDSEERNVKENAQYYRALLYIKNDDFSQAEYLLKAIAAQQNHLFHLKSKELLGKVVD